MAEKEGFVVLGANRWILVPPPSLWALYEQLNTAMHYLMYHIFLTDSFNLIECSCYDFRTALYYCVCMCRPLNFKTQLGV